MTRVNRAEEAQAERRRRQPGTLDRTQHLKLAVPQEVQERHPDCTFRWVNDTSTRMHALTVLDDWDKVDGVAPIPVGTDKEGRPVMAHLCKKKRAFFEHDQREKMDFVKRREAALVKAPEQSSPDGNVYAIAGNSISPGQAP